MGVNKTLAYSVASHRVLAPPVIEAGVLASLEVHRGDGQVEGQDQTRQTLRCGVMVSFRGFFTASSREKAGPKKIPL